ncbi:MAG: hypothetical protein QOH29_1896 [Actinomycetota bacterium]|nr:hypothetical protein [Actinomycetota bacterium]
MRNQARRMVAAGASLAALGATVITALPSQASNPASGTLGASAPTSSCQLGNGVQHVINITFDNVHFFRDNPNVPSDLEQMPALYNFLKSNGTIMSNMHTPLIAHTAEDSLAIYSGLYGDRHGQPVSNSYKTFKPDGTTEPDASFTYWNSPVINAATHAASTNDTAPSMVYSPTVPASATAPTQTAPEPWVALNKAGCSVGAFSTANMVLEYAGDIPTVFGTTPDLGTYANVNSAFIGEAIHCGLTDTTCNSADGAVTDTPPAANNPGSATYKALFGHKYLQPLVTGHASAPAPYRVADTAGNLVDLDNREIADFRGNVGSPGFSPTASQSLAMLASMQEAGVPVTYGYIADIHERKDWSVNCTTADAKAFGNALGPGDACYTENAQRYDQAFAKFLDRLSKDGITPKNTLFVIGSEENDHFDGVNVGRAVQPSDPVGCDGVTTPCRYAHNQVGELQANLPQLLSKETGNTTAFDVEPQGAAVYVHGQPAANAPEVRQLERDLATITANNPYSGVAAEKVVNYQAGATEQQILHLQTADPLRTPTITVFPKPDYYFDGAFPNCTASTTPAVDCVAVSSGFAWNHGYYSPDIDITWSAFVGPNVAHNGIDGRSPANSPAVTAPNGGGSVPQFSTKGTWADETDVRPTILYLAGIVDDYVFDGRVITELLRRDGGLNRTQELGDCYKQLNASVGTFGSDTLVAATKALATGSSSDDAAYISTDAALSTLGSQRDTLATSIKNLLDQAEFHGAHPDAHTVSAQLQSCTNLLHQAAGLAAA